MLTYIHFLFILIVIFVYLIIKNDNKVNKNKNTSQPPQPIELKPTLDDIKKAQELSQIYSKKANDLLKLYQSY